MFSLQFKSEEKLGFAQNLLRILKNQIIDEVKVVLISWSGCLFKSPCWGGFPYSGHMDPEPRRSLKKNMKTWERESEIHR